MNKDILLAWKKMYLNVVLSLCFSGNLRFKFKEYLRQLHLSWDWAEILAMSLFVSIILHVLQDCSIMNISGVMANILYSET